MKNKKTNCFTACLSILFCCCAPKSEPLLKYNRNSWESKTDIESVKNTNSPNDSLFEL